MMTEVDQLGLFSPSLVHDSEFGQLWHGYAESVLPILARGSADLLIADPPYGMEFRSNRGGHFPVLEGDDDTEWVPAMLSQAVATLRRGRHAYIFGPSDWRSTVPSLTAHVDLIWDKGIIGMGNLSSVWGSAHEPITFCVYEFSKANRGKGAGRLTARLRQGSILRYTRRHSGQVRHPTEKPVDLLRCLIESSSCLGETVLDPCMGSGSTAVAAILAGRRFLGCEPDPRYISLAVERIERAVALARQLIDL